MIVIVEGKNDYNKLKTIFPELTILTTNGSAISEEFINQIQKLATTRQIVLCLDPDYAGEKIRKKIVEKIPNVTHLYANQNQAISKNGKKIGIEHMPQAAIIEMFANIKIPHNKGTLTTNDLISFGLMGKDNSAEKRKVLGNKLGIGYGNAKQFLKRLNMFDISKKEIKRYL